MVSSSDLAVMRGLATRYAEVAASPTQDEKRALWRATNSLERTRPPIYARWLDSWRETPESALECEDPFFHPYETFLRQMIFQESIGDDYVIEPWMVVHAVHRLPAGGHWGMSPKWIRPQEGRGAGRWDAPIREPEDVRGLAKPMHDIDEEATNRNAARLSEAVGDIVPVVVSRAPAYQAWSADLSTDLAYLRGLEQVMWDMLDRPEWLHGVLAQMRDGVMAVHELAERAGDWRGVDNENQAMPYAEGLPSPTSNQSPLMRKDLWCFMAAQELAQVSPEMHWEFMLQYQIPILRPFGLVSYGCCENLTRKIGYLRRIPNLRRIAVAPTADVRACAEAIGRDYVMSFRPNPAEMVCCGFEPDHIRKVVRAAMDLCKDGFVDITLKDVLTVQGDASRIREWVKVVRSVSDDYC